MKLTLKQARRVEREIGTKLETALSNTGHRQTVSVYEDLRNAVSVLQTQTLNGLKLVKELTRIRFAIRKQIETANEQFELNANMNREAELKSLLKAIVSMRSGELSNDDLEILVQRHAQAKVANEKGTAVSRYGDATDEVQLSAWLRTETVAALDKEAKDIQRELVTVVDKLSALNSSTIDISGADAAILDEEGIIV